MERKFETLIGVQCYNGLARAGQARSNPVSYSGGPQWPGQDREAL